MSDYQLGVPERMVRTQLRCSQSQDRTYICPGNVRLLHETKKFWRVDCVDAVDGGRKEAPEAFEGGCMLPMERLHRAVNVDI